MSQNLQTPTALPFTISGSGSWQDLHQDLRQQQDRYRDLLLAHGALLFRGYDVKEAAAFQTLCQVLTPDLQPYVGGLSPRSPVDGKIYTSTSYSARQKIPLHNEACYLPHPPRTLYFCCETAPKELGATPLGDLQILYQKLTSRLTAAFENRHFCYQVNVHGGQGFGKSWQEMFATDDRTQVDGLLQSQNTTYHWSEDGALSLKYIAPAIRSHSLTGNPYWSAQLLVWHHANLPRTVAKGLFKTFGQEEFFPRAVFFEDGSKIQSELIEELAALTDSLEQRFEWQKGDVLILDNERIGHGREPFSSDRSIWVALA